YRDSLADVAGAARIEDALARIDELDRRAADRYESGEAAEASDADDNEGTTTVFDQMPDDEPHPHEHADPHSDDPPRPPPAGPPPGPRRPPPRPRASPARAPAPRRRPPRPGRRRGPATRARSSVSPRPPPSTAISWARSACTPTR